MKKINYYGTLGPSCDSAEILTGLFQAGMTGLRINLSHGNLKDCTKGIKNFYTAAKSIEGKPQLLIDLEGPELRIGNLSSPILLENGDEIILGKGPIKFPKIVLQELKVDQEILLDDGMIALRVLKRIKEGIHCRVDRGGLLKSRKSIAIPEADIKLPTLTANDYKNIALAGDFGVTGVMLPFVRSREDLITLKDALKETGNDSIKVFAKIENIKGVNILPELLDYCDEIVIARGDLGNSMPLYKLPGVQKSIAELCSEKGKPFMVVTQMLNSMIEKSVPTRAEVMDIYNAILDGASSVMLTGETAVGKYPIKAMEYLVNTSEEARLYINSLDRK